VAVLLKQTKLQATATFHQHLLHREILVALTMEAILAVVVALVEQEEMLLPLLAVLAASEKQLSVVQLDSHQIMEQLDHHQVDGLLVEEEEFQDQLLAPLHQPLIVMVVQVVAEKATDLADQLELSILAEVLVEDVDLQDLRVDLVFVSSDINLDKKQ
jgi:anti-sigma-K factor RskA